MTVSRKLARNRAAADLASVTAVLSRLQPDDYFNRVGLEGRRQELEAEVAQQADEAHDTAASAALFFGGGPVVGSQGIESGFAGDAISRFQDLVAKLAIEERGVLHQRGPLPAHEDAKLHVTGILRGSFGFHLEELHPLVGLFDSPLKNAVAKATRIIEAFSDANEDAFEQALEATDPRSLAAAKSFFALLGSSNATLRLETANEKLEVNLPAIERAIERADSSHVEEDEETVSGRLAGLLPNTHMFELNVADVREVLSGRVSKGISKELLATLLQRYLNEPVLARLVVRRVYRREDLVRTSYALQEVSPPSAEATAIG